MIVELLLASTAGAFGAALRGAISAKLNRGYPYGTLVVNLLGSMAIGVLMGMFAHGAITKTQMFILGGGFLGAFTTFSTWAYEAVKLLEQKRWGKAINYLLLSHIGGVSCAAAGYYLLVSAL